MTLQRPLITPNHWKRKRIEREKGRGRCEEEEEKVGKQK